MKKQFVLLLFIIIYSATYSQSTYKLITTINIQSDFFTTDKQGNIYAVKGNELTKYNQLGKELYKFSNIKLGNIQFVDASNMLKILLFYKDFLQIIFLDNTLSINGAPLSLDKIGFQQTQLACTSYNNGIWLYDQQNFELIQLDQNLEKQKQTGNLGSVLNTALQPNYLIEHDNKIYLNNPSTGILIFDIYGTYYKTAPIKKLNYFEVIGDWIYYADSNKIKVYNIKTTEEKQFEVPLSEFKKFSLEMNVLVLQTNDSIVLYSSE